MRLEVSKRGEVDLQRNLLVLLVGLLMSLSSVALAQTSTESETVPAFNALDTFWVLFAAILVFFMQAGFGLVEAGMVRAKNAGNILMKNLMDFAIASLACSELTIGELGALEGGCVRRESCAFPSDTIGE